MGKLKDTQIKALKPKDKQYSIADGDGLSLFVLPNGNKFWRFRYRWEGKGQTLSFGKYPEVSLAYAREKTLEARKKIAEGINPSKEKQEAKIKKQEERENTPLGFDEWMKLFNNPQKNKDLLFTPATTFRQWSEFYLNKIAPDVSEAHIERTRKGYKKDVYPIIGDMKMNDIRAKHIIEIMHIMADREAKASAEKVFSSISRCFQVCMANYPDLIERNPAKDITLKDILGSINKKKHYPIITDPQELGALLNAIDNFSGHTSTKLALKLIAHTFVRPHNIRYAEWSEFNSKTRQWVIPASKMKTGKELIVPLSKQVMKIISEAKEYSGDSKYLFPSPKGINTPLSDGALVGALRRMGYTKDEIVAHSFRGIFSTIAHEAKAFSHDVIETQLAHSVGNAVSQAYNRAEHLEDRVKMMQWWSDLLEEYSK